MVFLLYVKKSEAKAFFKRARFISGAITFVYAWAPIFLWDIINLRYESTLELVQNIWKLKADISVPFILKYGLGITGILVGLGICITGYILFFQKATKIFQEELSKFDSLPANELIKTSELFSWAQWRLMLLLMCLPLIGIGFFELADQANKDYLDAYEQIYNASINHQQ